MKWTKRHSHYALGDGRRTYGGLLRLSDTLRWRVFIARDYTDTYFELDQLAEAQKYVEMIVNLEGLV